MNRKKLFYVTLLLAVSGASCAHILDLETDGYHTAPGDTGNAGGGSSGGVAGIGGMGVAGMGVAGMGIAGMGIAGMGGVGGMAGAGGDSACNEGDTRHCYTGKVGTEGVGVCHGGTETCSSGAFGACLDEVAPSKEMYNMLDDDCNGLVDECNVEEQADLKGECLIGKLTDENGVVVCKQVNFPVAEKCKEGKDTNCDGAWGIPPTEDVTACPLDKSKTCLGGKWACVGPDGDQYVQCVAQEIHDGIDNNCNGLVDECTVEVPADLKGECLIGKLTDENGVVVCKQVNFPVEEKCNEGKDTNCDGAWGIPPTEAVTACPLDPSKTCLGGKWACVGPDGDQYVQCVAGEKCDGVDDNCNGTVDEMCI